MTTRIRERLDRFLATSSWVTLFPMTHVEHLMHYKSDHSALVIKCNSKAKKRRISTKKFKFKTSWLLDESCEAVVKESWERSVGEGVDLE